MKANEILGVVSEGTLKTDDLLSAFANALCGIDADGKYSELCDDANKLAEWFEYLNDEGAEYAADVVGELDDALNDLAPDGVWFGSHEGDGACFGFWAEDDAA